MSWLLFLMGNEVANRFRYLDGLAELGCMPSWISNMVFGMAFHLHSGCRHRSSQELDDPKASRLFHIHWIEIDPRIGNESTVNLHAWKRRPLYASSSLSIGSKSYTVCILHGDITRAHQGSVDVFYIWHVPIGMANLLTLSRFRCFQRIQSFPIGQS